MASENGHAWRTFFITHKKSSTYTTHTYQDTLTHKHTLTLEVRLLRRPGPSLLVSHLRRDRRHAHRAAGMRGVHWTHRHRITWAHLRLPVGEHASGVVRTHALGTEVPTQTRLRQLHDRRALHFRRLRVVLDEAGHRHGHRMASIQLHLPVGKTTPVHEGACSGASKVTAKSGLVLRWVVVAALKLAMRCSDRALKIKLAVSKHAGVAEVAVALLREIATKLRLVFRQIHRGGRALSILGNFLSSRLNGRSFSFETHGNVQGLGG